MKVSYFPELYPDELLYSYLARLSAHNGFMTNRMALEILYGNISVVPDVLFANPLSADFRRQLTSRYPMDLLVQGHTMLPYYTRFMPAEKQKMAYQVITGETAGIIRDLVAYPKDRKRTRYYLRYCPFCVKTDRITYGEAYFHRIHQAIHQNICRIHHCYLKDTAIPLDLRTSPVLHTLEETAVEEDINSCRNEAEIALADYCTELVTASTDNEADAAVGVFLHTQLQQPYISVRGKQRDMKKFHEDLVQFYAGCDIYIPEEWQLQKVFSGNRYDTFEIAQMAVFIKIPVIGLLRREKPEIDRTATFDAEIMRCRKNGLSYPSIAKRMGVSINLIKPIGEGRKKSHQRDSSTRGGGIHRFNWEEMDMAILDTVEPVVKELYQDDSGRPRKVAFKTVERQLGLPEGRLYRLPRCKAIVEKYYESQEQYWAREITWAYKTTIDTGRPVSRKTIKQLTNLSKQQILKSLPLLNKEIADLFI